MLLVALTGGIGSGKSSVSSRLADRGAVIIDADGITKELQEPGRAVFKAMVEHFGDRIVADDGALDRQAVADIVFTDEDELKALGKMVHPHVQDEIKARSDAHQETDRIVVIDVPLLVEGDPYRYGQKLIITVEIPPELQIARLVEHRGFPEDDARARLGKQATNEQRREKADFVVDNSGSVEDLDAEVERLWAWLAEAQDA